MQETVTRKEPADLETMRGKLQEKRLQKETALKQQKDWERHLSEVRKTERLMSQKRNRMEALSEEYGYVKDLENMASGNNSRKLVF